MNLLHITSKPIFPILDGGQLAMHKLLVNFLDLGFNVKNLTVETGKHPFDMNDFPLELQDSIYPEAHFIDTRIRPWKLFKSLFNKRSYHADRFINDEFAEKIKQCIQHQKFDYVVVESAFLLSYVDLIRKYSDAKIILRAHNVEYRIWRQHAKHEKTLIKRVIYKKLAEDLKRFELNFINQVDGVFCISEQDREFFRRRAIQTLTTVIPVYMDVHDEYIVNYENNDFHFVGSMGWKPNADAVRWIVQYIAPRLDRILPEAKIHIAGSSMPKSMRDLKTKNVVFHGKVSNMLEFMSTHGTLIVPLKSGSGVRIKILEALSIGVPIISTEKGREGIDLTPKKNVLSANITEEFILQMKNMYDKTEERKSMGQEGKVFILNNYSKEIISNRIREFISKI
jgi:glycosyltransferase involved in cell wall biosynthesis